MIAGLLPTERNSASGRDPLRDWLERHGQTPVSAAAMPALRGSAERCSAAQVTVLDGWIDNAAILAAELGLHSPSPAQLYEAAFQKWGDRCEERVIGHYAALTKPAAGTLRLARSPIEAPPLFYARLQDGAWAAASLPEAFFTLGLSRQLDWDELADLLALDIGRPARGSVFEGVERVPPGTIVTLSGDGVRIDPWYSARPRVPTPRRSCRDHIAEVDRLLGEACNAALTAARNPALALSGGLDSPVVADELLRQQQPGSVLHGLTFVPHPSAGAAETAERFADEWPIVERFAADRPALRVHRVDPGPGGFDYRFREIAGLAGSFNPALVHFGAHHGLWEKARTLGCDWLFSAGWGNQSFSAAGIWTYAEDFRGLRWWRMVRNLAARHGDPRPLWRKILVLAVLPNLPGHLQRAMRAIVHPSRRDALDWASVLSPAARTDYRTRAAVRGSAPALEHDGVPASREQAVQADMAAQQHDAAEITLALELHYGLRYRDVTAYRPLVEYCQSLPSEMFMRDGTDRFLARELARGRMPEAQRMEPRTGRHGTDWHARMAPRREELRAAVETIAGHPRLSRLLDATRMQQLLHEFPEGDAADELANLPYSQGLAQGLLAAQFVGLVEGSNAL